ncbi:MAG: AAA family ATPase [Bacteroidales bacterium]|nr:AAA family ATPase [Bacteroidales bacterium]
MIKEIVLRDFFSFRGENTIKLNPKGINLLVGINGSGKTSFINALRLLAEGVCGKGVEYLMQEVWNGYDEVVNFNGDRTAPCVQLSYLFDHEQVNAITPDVRLRDDLWYRITITRAGTSYKINERLSSARDDGNGDFVYLDFHNGSGRISTRSDDGTITLAEYSNGGVSGTELVVRQINDAVHYLPVHAFHRAVESLTVYTRFDVGEESKVRRPANFSTAVRLLKNGENLTQIVNDLKVQSTFQFAKMEDYLHRVNPSYRGIGIDNRYGQAYLYINEHNLSRVVGALHISDGTLRYLMLESIFLNPNRGAMVVVDEPENSLHPDMLRTLTEMMKEAAMETQVIVATHSPHLLNQFTLEDVLVFEKDEENRTQVKRPTESDFEDYDGDLLPGLLWLRGMIGGKVW